MTLKPPHDHSNASVDGKGLLLVGRVDPVSERAAERAKGSSMQARSAAGCNTFYCQGNLVWRCNETQSRQWM